MTKFLQGTLMTWDITPYHTILQIWKLRLRMEALLSAMKSLAKLENRLPFP